MRPPKHTLLPNASVFLPEHLPMFPICSLGLGLLAFILFVVGPANHLLQFDKTKIINGEIWRIVTCHWTHWSLEQLFWDMAAFIGLGIICELFNRNGFITCVVASAITIPILLCVFEPNMTIYKGLSGIDSALFIFVATWILLTSLKRRERLRLGLTSLTLLGFIFKTGFESASLSTFFVSQNDLFMPVPLAHAIGGLVGVTTALAFKHKTLREQFMHTNQT